MTVQISGCYGIARRIEQIGKDVLQLNQGTLYPALLRMEQEGWISSKWGGLREEPSGEILLHYRCRAETTRQGNRRLEAHVVND